MAFIHRFGSALNEHLHFHCCILDGVFESAGTTDGAAGVVFHPALGIDARALAPVPLPPPPPADLAGTQQASVQRAAARYLWAMLLGRIYEVLPLTCPFCHTPMRPAGSTLGVRIIAFINDASTVRQILERLGEATRPPRIAPARGPPLLGSRNGRRGEQHCSLGSHPSAGPGSRIRSAHHLVRQRLHRPGYACVYGAPRRGFWCWGAHGWATARRKTGAFGVSMLPMRNYAQLTRVLRPRILGVVRLDFLSLGRVALWDERVGNRFDDLPGHLPHGEPACAFRRWRRWWLHQRGQDHESHRPRRAGRRRVNSSIAQTMPVKTLVRNVRLVSGLLLMTFVIGHLVNLSIGLHSLAALESWRPALLDPWRTTIGKIVLSTAAAVHALLGLYALSARMSEVIRRDMPAKIWAAGHGQPAPLAAGTGGAK